MKKRCNNCKHEMVIIGDAPCRECDTNFDKWEPSNQMADIMELVDEAIKGEEYVLSRNVEYDFYDRYVTRSFARLMWLYGMKEGL